MPLRNTLSHRCRKSVSRKELENAVLEVLQGIEGVSSNKTETGTCEMNNILIEAIANTWSRAARRKKLNPSRLGEASVGVPDVVEVQLVCCLEPTITKGQGHKGRDDVMILFHWAKGCDRQLFEGFASHVGRKVDSSLAMIGNEPMNIE